MERLDCTSCEFKSQAARLLNKQDLETLAKHCARVSFKRGENIIREGALSLNIAYLREGIVKYHIKGPVHEQIMKITKAPTYIGIPTAIGDRVNHYSVTALSQCEVCFIDAEVFKQFLYRNGMFAYEIIQMMSKNELENFSSCVNRVQKQIRGKVAEALLMFADKIFESDTFTLPLTREEFANLLDTSRESACRIMNEFAEAGYISLKARDVEIINREKLKKISQVG